ncbi:nuclear transport factor 2 family protein [Streptomyces sp. NPDC005803]|uniref:nuclear transport factor 2 family protein n=1 Tax=Streptomyces sp. NPDC005803 TaxID=3154297 RepID=UPI0034013335
MDAARLARIEARQEIGQIPIRYAIAVDSRDMESWVNLFVPDVSAGRRGRGREALRTYIDPMAAWFYRSVHLICGHQIDLGPDEGADGPTTATGKVYCRAEHEVGDRWIVMAIRYDDVYRKVAGAWLLESRKERYWYAADVTERPQAVRFDSWDGNGQQPSLPAPEGTWERFWAEADAGAVTASPLS